MINYEAVFFLLFSMRKVDDGEEEQAGAELCQAQLPTGILLNWD